MEGIEAAHAIRADHPGIGVAVLSQHTDESYAFALLQNGSSGLACLLKDRTGSATWRTSSGPCGRSPAAEP